MPSVLPSPKSLSTIAAIALLATVFSGCATREERIQEIEAEANNALFADNAALAIEVLQKGLEKYPDAPEMRISLSRALRNTGQLEEAAQQLETVIEQDPERDQLWVQVGELRAQLGQGQLAVEALESYLTNHANDFLAWKALAEQEQKLGNMTQAIKAATKWNDQTPSSQPSLKLGELYLASGNVPQARSWFSQAAAYADAGAAKDALAELIRLETSLKQFQQASIWLAEYQTRYRPDTSDPRVSEAKQVLENWIRAREEIAQAAAELERERRQLEERNAAAEAPSPIVVDIERPTPEETEENRVLTNAATDEAVDEKPPEPLFSDLDSAVENAETLDGPASEANPSLSDEGFAPYELALSDMEAQNYDSAIARLWELLGDSPDSAELWYQLSLAYHAQENWYDAESTILEAKRREPRSEVIANQYLNTISKTQNINRVLEEIKAQRQLFPNSSAIALTLARTLRDASASHRVIARAYQDFLSLSSPGNPANEEARQFTGRNL